MKFRPQAYLRAPPTHPNARAIAFKRSGWAAAGLLRACDPAVLDDLHAGREKSTFGTRARSGASIAAGRDARSEERKPQIVAASQRHFEDALGVDHLAHFAGLGVNQHGRGARLRH